MWLTRFRRHSIKRELATSLVIGAFVLWLLIIVGSYFTIRHEVDELFDGELSQLSRVLLTLYASDDIEEQVSTTGTLVTAPPFEGEDNYENELLFQIWSDDNTLLVRSSNAPLDSIAAKSQPHELNRFDTVDVFKEKTRVFTLWIEQAPFVVQVGQKLEIRNHVAVEILESFYFLFFVILPLLLLLIFRSINKGLKSLNTIAGEITQRTSDNLEPVDLANVPAEIKGVTHSLNNLFERLKRAFAHERQFIADLAHELRTPLAGLKAQAQIALADKNRVEKSLTRIVEGVDRTSRLANQLLSLSRLETDQVELQKQRFPLSIVIEEVCHDLEPFRLQKIFTINKQIDTALNVNADRNMLYMLVRNLLENSLRYSANDTAIDIVFDMKNSRPNLRIVDNGPGIPEQSMSRIYDRFYRDINTKESGSGLGLAIVKRICDLHNIKLNLENRIDPTGLKVELEF